MVLSGHVHNYQRTCSVFKNTCVPPAADGSSQAPVWIVNGNAGQWLSTAEPVVPPFFEAVGIEHGYLRYHVNQTTLFAEVRPSHHPCDKDKLFPPFFPLFFFFWGPVTDIR